MDTDEVLDWIRCTGFPSSERLGDVIGLENREYQFDSISKELQLSWERALLAATSYWDGSDSDGYKHRAFDIEIPKLDEDNDETLDLIWTAANGVPPENRL
ncbi:hypothetical protein [Shimia abyssi]|uniref:Uncharacterized protein n=1 Tax=Shimia abyssi TaxID=1662395 RepID=A0A2P8ET41_9RHOB|nr:hypothetical protein [Shimia abyssi]PSL12641.1 hypothetical protein CLV88_1385 [Shimia abyssi]